MIFSALKRNSALTVLSVLTSIIMLPAQAQQVSQIEESSQKSKWPQATLNAAASSEVQQDTVRITLVAELSNPSQAKVASTLSSTLDAVMKEAKLEDKVKSYSGNYRLWPFNNESGKITNWQGRAEIILEASDFAAASALAAKLSDRMPIANMMFSVSPQARSAQEQALLSKAAVAFAERAKSLTQAFGFADYSVRNIELDGSGVQYQSAPRMMSMAADKAAVPLEAGTETVTVSIRGSIFLHSDKK